MFKGVKMSTIVVKDIFKNCVFHLLIYSVEEEHYVIVFFSEDNYIDHVFLLVAAHIMLQKRFCQL